MGNTNCACIREYLVKEPNVEMDVAPMRSRQENFNDEPSAVETSQAINIDFNLSLNTRLILQSLGRGHIIRKTYADTFKEAKKAKLEKQSQLDMLKPENRYKVITTNLREMFKTPLVKHMEDRYGKFDMKTPLDDEVQVEAKPTFLVEDGLIYKGEWDEQGNKHGRGREIHPDGTQYVGYFKNGKMDGRGRLIHPNGDIYEGEFKNGIAHGSGILRYENGDVYEGSFKYNIKRGDAEERLANGTVYKGAFFDGRRHGNGFLTLPNGDTFEGEFKNGLLDGKGNHKSNKGYTYMGEWKEGKMNGEGEFASKEGVYNGQFFNDVKQGWGRFVYSDSRVYEGYWKDGQQHGEGWIGTDGNGKKGVWKNGRRIKWI